MITISDGVRSVSVPFTGERGWMWVAPDSLVLPVPARANTYTDPAVGDGRRRVQSKFENAEGSFSVFVDGDDQSDFWGNVDELQEIVESTHSLKGTVRVVLPGASTDIYDVESIEISGVPVRGTMLPQQHLEVEIKFECRPFSRGVQDWAQGLTVLNSNSGFESNTTGWSSVTSTLTRVTSDAHTGVACCQVAVSSSTGRGLNNTSLVTVPVSQQYSAHCYVKAPTAAAVGKTVLLRLEELTASSVNVGQSETRVTLTGEWQKVRVSRSFGGTGARARVHVLNVTSGAVTWLVDDIRLFASEVLTGPIDWFQVSGVSGHVPALGALSLFDVSGEARNHVEVGVQAVFDPANPEPVHLAAVTEFTALAGASNTRAGSHSANVLRAGVGTNPIPLGTSGSRTHKGLWKFRARVFGTGPELSCRLSWRTGTGPWTDEQWVRLPLDNAWCDVDLGIVDIPVLELGHSFEFRVVAVSSGGLLSFDLDFVEPVPADSWSRLSSVVVSEQQSGYVAYDDFSTHSAGAVSGKTPVLVPAGTWSGAGDADDFQVEPAYQRIYRNAVSDSNVNNGRYLRCGSGVLTTTIMRVDVFLDRGMAAGTSSRVGGFVRYVNVNNWLGFFYKNVNQIELRKRVSGTETVIATDLGVFRGWRSLVLTADTSGGINGLEGPQGFIPDFKFTVAGDTDVATGGTLASGGYGIYDATTETTAPARYYDNFVVSSPSSISSLQYSPINANRGTDLLHDTAQTEDTNGTSISPTPHVEGKYLTLPPATRTNQTSRVVVRARRNNLEMNLTDTGLTDVLTADLDVTPRNLIV